jgi:hypothetical protein
MDAFLSAIQNTPLPTIFVVAGILFWVLAIAAGSVAGKITIRPDRQWAAGILGSVFIVAGMVLYIVPTGHTPLTQPAPAPSTTQPQDSNKPFVDSVQIQSIGPRPDAGLHNPTDIRVELVYSLFSADTAILAVFLEQFPQTAAGCNGDNHQTNGATYLHVARGEHVVTVVVHWPGAAGTGFLTIGAIFWKDVDGHAVEPSTELGLFRELCYAYGP